jgi:hypothetical protein
VEVVEVVLMQMDLLEETRQGQLDKVTLAVRLPQVAAQARVAVAEQVAQDKLLLDLAIMVVPAE